MPRIPKIEKTKRMPKVEIILVTAGELAAHLFLDTERRVQQLAKEGIIIKKGHGKYPLDQCREGYIRWLRDRSKEPETTIEAVTAKERKEAAQAETAELQLAQLKNELFDASSVEVDWKDAIATIAQKISISEFLTLDQKEAVCAILRTANDTPDA
jgi:phage terminase Nu1 subunit (DNA packaging protein)